MQSNHLKFSPLVCSGAIASFVIGVFLCRSPSQGESGVELGLTPAQFSMDAPAAEETSSRQTVLLQSKALNESSGISVSTRDPRIVWTHNDSGGKARIYAFRRDDGQLLAEVDLKGIQALDFEDMCSFSRDGRSYLAIGDVGDNSRKRKSVFIYVVQEPELPNVKADSPKPRRLRTDDIGRLQVTYPDGPVNCEALAYDPIDDVFVLPSKETLRCRWFQVDAADLSGPSELRAKLSKTVLLPLVTGGDISRDGRQFVLSTYGPGCLIRRSSDDEWVTQGEQAWLLFELPHRKQGESICFGESAERLLLTSEFAPTPLFDISTPRVSTP